MPIDIRPPAEDELRAAMEAAESAFGALNVLVNNAGVQNPPAPIENTDQATWSRILDINLLAHIRAARILLPGWIERGSGYFVSTASAAVRSGMTRNAA